MKYKISYSYPYKNYRDTKLNDEIHWRYQFAYDNQTDFIIRLGKAIENKSIFSNGIIAQTYIKKINQSQRIIDYYCKQYLKRIYKT